MKIRQVYSVELRKRINQNLNKEIESFGLFSSEQKALRWIDVNGEEKAKSYQLNSGFYAIMRCEIDNPNWDLGLAVSAHKFNGEKTYFFK